MNESTNPTPVSPVENQGLEIPQHIIDVLAVSNETASDALSRVNRASIGSLRADSSLAYLRGLERHVAAWLGRIEARRGEMENV